MAVWYGKARAGALKQTAVLGIKSSFGMENVIEKGPGEDAEVLGAVPEYTRARACGKHVARCGCDGDIMRSQTMRGLVLPR